MAAAPAAASSAPPKKQKLRGLSFTQEYRGLTAARAPVRRPTAAQMSADEPGGRTPSMDRAMETQHILPAQAPEDRDKVVLVLDLDETLVFAREGPLFARPGLDEFFATCAGKAEIVVWTAGMRAYAQAILREIDRKGVVKHLIYRHSKWFTGRPGYRKDLAALGRSLNKTIIIENTPDCIRGYTNNGILVEDYRGGEVSGDNTIPALTAFCRDLIAANEKGMTVPEFVTTNKLLRRGPVQTDLGPVMTVYMLDVNTVLGDEYVRVNADLRK
jgi:hypothetical protein